MKKASEVIHKNPEFCTLETRVSEVKYLMKKYDYQEITIVNDEHTPVGIITNASVSDEALENFLHPFDLKASELMKSAVVVKNETSLDECLKLMESNHLMSLPVADDQGHYCGIVKKEDLENFFS